MSLYPGLKLLGAQKNKLIAAVIIEVLVFGIIFFWGYRGVALIILEAVFLVWLIHSMLKLSTKAKILINIQVVVVLAFLLLNLVAGMALSGQSLKGSDLYGLMLFFVVYALPVFILTIVVQGLYRKVLSTKNTFQSNVTSTDIKID